MPSFDQHLEQASSNITFLKSFAFNRANDWTMTIMFYTVLHIAEAIIWKKANILIHEKNDSTYDIHCKNHDDRERTIKSLIPEIHFEYTQLSKAAHNGRYKVYKFRNEEVITHHESYFKPIINYFNSFAQSHKIDKSLNCLK